jgi:hypothetical protein
MRLMSPEQWEAVFAKCGEGLILDAQAQAEKRVVIKPPPAFVMTLAPVREDAPGA